MSLTKSLRDLNRGMEAEFGGKSTSLGELLDAEIPVPPGFAVSTDAFHAFIDAAEIGDRIAQALAGSGGSIDAANAASERITELIGSAPLPSAVAEEICSRYAELARATGEQRPAVAVRSSAVGEDGDDATFAGQQETYLWIRGDDNVCRAVSDCWASLYSPPAISYRAKFGQVDQIPAMGVTIQAMVDAEVSGVMFTCNPLTGDPSTLAINASWGLGLAVVGGEVTPDDYLLSKVTGEVIRSEINTKSIEYVADASSGSRRIEVPPARQEISCLDQSALSALHAVARKIEAHFKQRQDIEWAFARGLDQAEGLFVVQSRPVTALPSRGKRKQGSAISLVMETFGAVGKRSAK